MRQCHEGHELPFWQSTCEHGHPISTDTSYVTTGQPTEMQQLIKLMTQQMHIQGEQMRMANETMRQQGEAMRSMQGQIEDLRSQRQTASANTKRPDRPTVDTGITDHDWAVFMDSWKRYKLMSKLTDPEGIRNELRATCS